MKLYAELGRVRARQLVSDAVAAAAALLFVLLGVVLYRLVAIAAALGEAVEDLGSAVGRVPGLGGVGSTLIESGRTQQDAVLDIALLIGVGVAALGVMAVLAWYLPRRLAWIRDATAAVLVRDDPAALPVLAHRAMARRSLVRVLKAVPTPGVALTHGDHVGLADLELRALGLRGPQPRDGRIERGSRGEIPR